ncbi:MAG: DUF2110 family protein [Halobacteriaceae archaeon]
MVVLATKIYVSGDARDRALQALDAMVEDTLGDLDVTWEIGVRHDGFPSVTIEGADATVARNAIGDQWGTIRPTHEDGEELVGTFEAWDDAGFDIDIGQSLHVPATELGLGPGDPDQIRTRFGLVQHLPMRVVATDPPRLADTERDRLYEWRRGPDRVNVNSVTRGEVRATINRAGHADDIVTVERLGLLEHSIVCREGTDAPGLLASIGDYLPAELLCVV